eukprot:TRINITY_DN22464_c0_g1_i1.p1 TRINITY_DN22464_c0_g1~~TRINITY_DN22464_c0_g1_i1.p1  ORF type:complete len:511 (+),score=95.93 TRINITY_DN22464_c0_g1_i1:137-1669(+)
MMLRQGPSVPQLESYLFLARDGQEQKPTEWQRVRVAHNSDGSLSFRPCESERAGQELFLDADWRQPFFAAPGKPFSLSSTLSRAGGSSGRRLFPFSLSYAPLQGREPPAQRAVPEWKPKRRSVVLASTDARVRDQWLACLSRKASSPQLRASGEFSSLADMLLLSQPNSKRRYVQLGESHVGLPKLTRARPPMTHSQSLPRLPPARPQLWESSSSLGIVRDLLDGYAADPLPASLKTSAASKHGMPTPCAEEQQERQQFLTQYVEKQASIERLLEDKLRPVCVKPATPTLAQDLAEVAAPSVAKAQAGEEQMQLRIKVVLDRGFEVLARTSNIVVEGAILRNELWSGGALLSPLADGGDNDFQLEVSPLDTLQTNPFFIGIAPADANLTQANFFDTGGGIFLCLGGTAFDGLMGALGAAGGPAVHAFGERLPEPDLPYGAPGCKVQLNYTEALNSRGELEGHICFTVSEPGGNLIQSKPQLQHRIPGGVGWLPCILLCTPETKLHVKYLA